MFQFFPGRRGGIEKRAEELGEIGVAARPLFDLADQEGNGRHRHILPSVAPIETIETRRRACWCRESLISRHLPGLPRNCSYCGKVQVVNTITAASALSCGRHRRQLLRRNLRLTTLGRAHRVDNPGLSNVRQQVLDAGSKVAEREW